MSTLMTYSEWVVATKRGGSVYADDGAPSSCDCGEHAIDACKSCGDAVCSQHCLDCEGCRREVPHALYCANCSFIEDDMTFCARHMKEHLDEMAIQELGE